MNMVIPNEGKKKILDEVFRLTSARESFVLDTFKTAVTVVDASTFADFVLSDFGGYAQVAIARADFGAATITADIGIILKTAAPVFTCSSGAAQDIYGWILRGATSGIIYAGQNLAVARNMAPGATWSPDPFQVKDKTFV